MKYQALYRKYRPKNFDEVSGQKTTIKILKNSIKNKKIAHAYLFYGPRGTGKTSIAKIFSRAVNCLENNNGIQCEKCNNCLLSNEKECVDIIEIDAASNNGVDEIRDLKSKINFVPSELKYKVYIIDEVHMLSIGAFNALLKTLEEPPEHIIFILATTEFNKVPTTIVSRCQTFEFMKINENDIEEKIKEISIKEQIKIEHEAIEEIAKYSNGGLRDAIGLLEKAIAYSEDEINVNTIKEISGNISNKELENFLTIFENKNIELILKKINEFYNSGVDLIKLVNDLIEHEKNIIVNQKQYDTNKCLIIKKLDELVNNMKKSENPKIIFEVTLLNMMLDSEIENNNKNITEKKEQTEEIKKVNSEQKQNIKNNLKEIRVSNTLCNPEKQIIIDIRAKWNELKNLAFDTEYGNLARLLSSDIVPVAASKQNIILTSKLVGLSEQINNDIYKVDKIFEKIFENKYKVICLSENEWNQYIKMYKQDKNSFKYTEEHDILKNEKTSLREKARELFEEI